MPPFNGSGTFTPYTPGNPAVTGTVISSTAFNATQQDIAAGLSNAVTRDGQSPLTANLPAAGRKITGLGAGVVAGDSLRFEQLFSQGTEQDIASAATVDIGGLNTTIARITGTTTITSFGTNYNGPRYVRFAGALLLTHNATTLILPGGANITTAAGDRAILTPVGNPAAGWQVLAYQRADGTALVSTPGAITASGLTMSTARMLGRLTASTGAIEELTATQVTTNFVSQSSDTVAGKVELATSTEYNSGSDAARVPSVQTLRENTLFARPAASMAGNTIIEFTSIPSWVKRISITFSAMSNGSASPIFLRVGTASGYITSGYSGSVMLVANTGVDSIASTTGARITTTQAPTDTFAGRLVVEKMGGINTWTITGVISQSDSTRGSFVAVSIDLASALTRVAMYPDSGTFDSGSISAIYE